MYTCEIRLKIRNGENYRAGELKDQDSEELLLIEEALKEKRKLPYREIIRHLKNLEIMLERL
jgi:hypothetical protein